MKHLLALLIVLFAFSQAIPRLQMPWLQSLERLSQDVRLSQSLNKSAADLVVIVDIDEASLREYGQWPWPRTLLANLVDILFDDYQINTLAFDMVFAESADAQWQQRLALLKQQELAEQFAAIGEDKQLAYSFFGRKVVTGMIFKQAGDTINEPSFSLAEIPDEWLNDLDITQAKSVTANLDVIQQSAVSSGFFDNPLVDADGIFRRAPLLQIYQGNLYPSLALATVQQALDGIAIDIEFDQYDDGTLAVNYLQLGRHVIKAGAKASAVVPYAGAQGSFKYLSAKDVLQGRLTAGELQGKIVLVGTTAPGLKDLRATPVDKQMAGVEVHANLIAGILQNNIRYQPVWALAAELCSLLILFILLWPALIWLRPIWSMLATLLAASALIALNFNWWQQGLIVPLANSLLAILLLFLTYMAWGYLLESSRRRYIFSVFGQYVPPELASELAANQHPIRLEGESKELTVLFSDVRGFTSLSEGLTPEALTKLMNQILTPLTHAIHQHSGTIDKYMGDAIMAFWGAPLDDAMHASHSLDAAFAMLAAIDKLNIHLANENLPKIKMGIGINTGNMSVGNMGSEFRMAYTVMGDAVNLGSRIEGLTKFYGVDILVSQHTAECADDYLYRLIDRVQVKGKDQAVQLLEPMGKVSELEAQQIERIDQFNQAFEYYLQQEWQQAHELILQLQQQGNEPLFELYLERINTLQSTPVDKEWQGVFVHQSK